MTAGKPRSWPWPSAQPATQSGGRGKKRQCAPAAITPIVMANGQGGSSHASAGQTAQILGLQQPGGCGPVLQLLPMLGLESAADSKPFESFPARQMESSRRSAGAVQLTVILPPARKRA